MNELIADIKAAAEKAKKYRSLTVTINVSDALALIAALEQSQLERNNAHTSRDLHAKVNQGLSEQITIANKRIAELDEEKPQHIGYVSDFTIEDMNNGCHSATLWSNPEGLSGAAAVYIVEPTGKLPAVPNGWDLVPIEPTMDILNEFDSIVDFGAEDSRDAWGRLLAAAPKKAP